MESFISFESFDDANIKAILVRWKNGGVGRFIAPHNLLRSTVFKQPVENLHAAIGFFGMASAKSAQMLSPAGWKERAAGDIASNIGRPFRAVVVAALDRAAELDAWRERQLSTKVEPSLAAESRAWLRSLKVGEAARLAMTYSDVAAAALSCWHLSGLPDTLRAPVEDSLILANLTDIVAAQGDCKIAPSLEVPLARGINRDRATNRAKQAMDQHAANRAEIDQVSSMLTSAVEYAAIAADIHPSKAFGLLAEGPA